jgi:hypothetical protein
MKQSVLHPLALLMVKGYKPSISTVIHHSLEEKTILNDYATTTKIVHKDSFSVVFQSLWTVLVVVA